MKNRVGGYYDIEIDIEKALVEGGMVSEVFYLKDLKQRKLFLSEDVNQYTIGDIVKNILQYNREDYELKPEARKPILLYIASNGGEVDAGFELIDVILSRLVDTFISRISLTMLPVPNPHNTVCVLSWEEARHWQSRSSGYSSS